MYIVVYVGAAKPNNAGGGFKHLGAICCLFLQVLGTVLVFCLQIISAKSTYNWGQCNMQWRINLSWIKFWYPYCFVFMSFMVEKGVSHVYVKGNERSALSIISACSRLDTRLPLCWVSNLSFEMRQFWNIPSIRVLQQVGLDHFFPLRVGLAFMLLSFISVHWSCLSL